MKRFLSLIMVLIILVFSCVPVFGITVDNNYFNFENLSLYDSSFVDFNSKVYTFINDNISNDIYIVPFRYYMSNKSYKSFAFIFFPNNTSVSFTETDSSITDSTYSDYTLTEFVFDGTYNAIIDYHYVNSRVAFESSFTSPSTSQRFVNHKIFDSSNFLLFRDGNCVSEAFCSTDYYVGGNSGDDYEEGNVVIEGLGGFFDDILNSMKNTLNTIKELPSTIITGLINGLKELFIPSTDIMKESFQEFIDYMTSKFGFNDLISTLQGLVDSVSDDGSTVGAADISENFNYTFGDESVSLNFSVPFSDFFDSVSKNRVGGYLKGIFFLLLIFYNLSELYFIIRGVRPWKNTEKEV